MNPAAPDNPALDALFLRSTTHPEVRVELCRALLEAELFTLIPQEQGLQAGDEEMRQAQDIPFMLWAQQGKQYFFVYTSELMARKALKTFTDPTREPMMIVSMVGREMLELMRRPGVGIALNAGAVRQDFTFNDAVVAGILDGTMFDPPAPEEQMEGKMKALRPGEYPLSLVQPVFDYLKTRPEALAAWVLQMVDDRGDGGNFYLFALLTSTEDSQELQDSVGTVLAMVNASDRKGMEFGVTAFDYGDPEHAAMMRSFVPFYAAPDHKSPAATEQK